MTDPIRTTHAMNAAANADDSAVWIMRCGTVVAVDALTGALTPDVDFVLDSRLTIAPNGRVCSADVDGDITYIDCDRCTAAVIEGAT